MSLEYQSKLSQLLVNNKQEVRVLGHALLVLIK